MIRKEEVTTLGDSIDTFFKGLDRLVGREVSDIKLFVELVLIIINGKSTVMYSSKYYCLNLNNDL